MGGKRLQWVDVFAKTAQDSRIKTTSGGILTILSLVVIVWLFINEIRAYNTIIFEPQLGVDPDLSQRLDIYLDIEFPNLPCEMLSLDAMDIVGDIQEHIDDTLVKSDLDGEGKPLDPAVKQRQANERKAAIDERLKDSNYKGSCYGARPDDESCNTCDDIRKAYAWKNWKFDDGSGFDQCNEEHYPQHIAENANNGCRMQGKMSVGRVAGNLHFAPGESIFTNGQHTHDLSGYNKADMPYNFAHKVHRFSFGEGHESLLEDPLAGFEVTSDHKSRMVRYFMKVVPTRFEYNNGTVFDTNQYSVTWHERPLSGGRDEDHPNSFHGVGGAPGIWVGYDISPMRVVNVERRQQTLGTLVMNMCAILGAVVTSAALLDRGVYEIDQALQARKER